MQDLIIKFFEGSGAILEPLKQEKNINSNIYYYKYINYVSINKLNLIIKSLKAFLNKNIIYSFENLILKIEVESNENQKLLFENYFHKIPKNENYIFLGIKPDNTPYYEKIENIKSLLIGGSSGSGKSNLIHELILSIILNNKNIYLLLIDMKAVELTRYNTILKKSNRLIKPVATNQKTAFKTILFFYNLIKYRYKKMQRKKERLSSEPPIVLIIDEYAQLFNNNKEKKVINNYISKIGAIGRACNCYLILATQHPTNENITNTIRVNLQSKIALKCDNVAQSKNILNATGAEQIKQPGQAIIHIDGKQKQNINISFVSDTLLNKIESLNK